MAGHVHMKNAVKLAIAAVLVFLASSCGMSDEQGAAYVSAYKECADSVGHLDIYRKDGTHFSKTDLGKDFEREICGARAKLYTEGYRIGKTAKQGDYEIYQLYLMSDRSAYGVYKKLIKSGIEP